MSVIHVIEQHDQLLDIWHSQNSQDLKIVHLDFHCDMRGLLIDRDFKLAYPVKFLDKVDEGNFLMHAIKEGRVKSLRWAHNIPGGRQYDVGTVMYTSDLSVQPLWWLLQLKGEPGIPLDYEVMEFDQWQGLKQGEFLNIDWDCFASDNYLLETVDRRVESFFSRDFPYIPEQTCVCYSPKYSLATRDKFEDFIKRLSQLFEAKILYTPKPIKSEVNKADQPWLQRFYYQMRYQLRHIQYESVLWLRRKNIY
jgi:hypothetical protein